MVYIPGIIYSSPEVSHLSAESIFLLLLNDVMRQNEKLTVNRNQNRAPVSCSSGHQCSATDNHQSSHNSLCVLYTQVVAIEDFFMWKQLRCIYHIVHDVFD